MAVYDQVKQALQDILAPELQALKAEIRRLDGRLGALDEKFEGLRHEIRTVLEMASRPGGQGWHNPLLSSL
ncbi:TPA: hypothetical protein DCL37_08375 [Candidatus Acetothermia bacterium]|nr:hypothetical protein [Candidatus Bipolaricaulota bacterium]HAF71334.1 hypothetical protein [Candidatus Acetothermia bacterium]